MANLFSESISSKKELTGVKNSVIIERKGNGMGGLAIKKVIGTEAERFSKNEYSAYKNILLHKNFHVYCPVEIQEKDSYGDIDVLLNSSDNIDLYKKTIIEEFNKIGVSYEGETINGKTHSLSLGKKQVDITLIEHNNMSIAYNYYSNNDFGNLLGRIANSIGMKFGYNGLHWIERDGDQVFGEFCITKDIKNVLFILGFSEDDVAEYEDVIYSERGFKTYEDMFAFVTKSKYFDGSKYLLHNLNQENRIRNKKRKTYMNFIGWLNKSGNINKTPEEPILPKRILLKVLNKDIQTEYVNFLLEIEEKKFSSAKFNGKIVMELIPQLSGKSLGEFIAIYKERHPNYLLYTNKLIHQGILELWDEMKKYQIFLEAIK